MDMMSMFKRRRGRKSKMDKMFEAAAIEAMVRGGGQEMIMPSATATGVTSASNPYQAFGQNFFF